MTTGLVRMMRGNFLQRQIMKRALKEQYGAVQEMLPIFELAVEAHAAGRDLIFRGAPVVVLFCGEPTKALAPTNAQLAIENAIIAADAAGLGSVYCGVATAAAERDERFLTAGRVSAGLKIYGILAIGYPKVKPTRWIERPPRISWV